VLKITCLFCLASFSYWMVLFFYGTNLIDWIYAGKFSQYAETLRLIGSLPIFYSIHLVFSSALRAMEKPFYILQASLLSTLVTLSVGLWMAFKWKVIGAQLGWLVSYIVGTAFIISYFIAFRSSQDKIHA
nr:polysaccharide biosynthesis C-terminal domain-containing protein [Nitrospirales bacterium]